MARVSTRRMLRGGIAALSLNPADKLVLLALVDRSDAAGVSFPSQYTLARDVGLSRSTVQEALARLLASGVIVEHEKGRQGRSTRYLVTVQLARSPG